MKDISSVQLRRLDMSQLLVFSELMRHRKQTAVARNLGLTQSAISHALKRLRITLGDELFLRRAAGVEPTARALALEGTVAEVLRLVTDALRVDRPFDPTTETRIVRIGALDHQVAFVAPGLIRALRRAAPGMRASFIAAVRGDALDGLANGSLDLALGYFPSLPDAFDSAALLEDSYAVVLRKGHPLAARKLTLKAYCAADHLLVSAAGEFTGIVDTTLRREGLSRRVIASVPQFFAALATVAASDLIVTLPARLARMHARRFGLVVAPPPLAIRPFTVSVVWHKRAASDPALRWIRQQMVGRLHRAT
jgi:DNA-binding transcriptional LysR family regulator